MTEYYQNWYQKNKKRISKKNKKLYKNPKIKAKIQKRNKKYKQNNKEKCLELTRNWHKKNRKYLSSYSKIKYHQDSHYKLKMILRTRLNNALNRNYKSGSAINDLGCSIEEFKKYIESKWKLGMNWSNHTTNGWHIDHIIPLDSFNLTNRKELLKACHYTNLQPLWAKDNLRKNKFLISKEK